MKALASLQSLAAQRHPPLSRRRPGPQGRGPHKRPGAHRGHTALAAASGAPRAARAEGGRKRFNLTFWPQAGSRGRGAGVCRGSPRRDRLGSGGHGAIPAAVKVSRLVRASVMSCRVSSAGFEMRRSERTPAEPPRWPGSAPVPCGAAPTLAVWDRRAITGQRPAGAVALLAAPGVRSRRCQAAGKGPVRRSIAAAGAHGRSWCAARGCCTAEGRCRGAEGAPPHSCEQAVCRSAARGRGRINSLEFAANVGARQISRQSCSDPRRSAAFGDRTEVGRRQSGRQALRGKRTGPAGARW